MACVYDTRTVYFLEQSLSAGWVIISRYWFTLNGVQGAADRYRKKNPGCELRISIFRREV